MDGLITLADVPELKGSDPKPTTKIVIGRLDDNLRDPRYGKFAITQRHLDGWKRNLSETFGGQVSMDFDHSSDRGNGTKAACWITSIDQAGTANGSLITADVQFTRAGAKAVRDGEYKYTSPTFVENYVDEHGEKHGPALIGGALTNRPVLRKGMPTLSLSKDHPDGTVADAPSRERKRARRAAATLLASRPAADSRAHMASRDELIKLLDLPSDAGTDQILAAACLTLADPGDGSAGAQAIADAAAQVKATKKAKKAAKKGKQTMARDEDGNVILDAQGLAELMTKANAGQAAAAQLAGMRFETAWTKALSEGRAAPAQEETMRALFAKDEDLAVKTLDSFVRIVPTTPAGSGEGPTATAPAGMDEDRFQLHTEATALAAKKREADPSLDEGAAYALAAVEIEERKFALANPGI